MIYGLSNMIIYAIKKYELKRKLTFKIPMQQQHWMQLAIHSIEIIQNKKKTNNMLNMICCAPNA